MLPERRQGLRTIRRGEQRGPQDGRSQQGRDARHDAEMAAASLSAGSAPAAASIATSPVIVSVKVRHGGATRISSGRRRATKLMARPIL